MNMQSLRDVLLSDPSNRDRAGARRRIVTPDAREPRGTHAKLWLDKYIPFQEQKRDRQLQRSMTTAQASSQQNGDGNSRSQLVCEVSALPIPPIYKEFYLQWVQNLDRFGARHKESRAKGRMVLGLGAESVLETSIALHHTYGVPYIPGSALKGLAASYLRWQFGEKWRDDATKRQQYKIIFGDTDEAGYITFFDAFYIPDKAHKGRALQRDVITVHHPDYYKEAKNAEDRGDSKKQAAPVDWDNPNPVSFLSATGYYLIALAAPDLKESELWINATFDILNEALQHWGIGAKTSSGYGRMELYLKEMQEAVQISAGAQKCIDKINEIPKALFNQRINDAYKDWLKFEAVEDRLIIGKIIIERIEHEGYTQAKSKKEWYQEIERYIREHQLGKDSPAL